jgi:putative exosortase-associated protein (TIGR04073 family)
MRPFDHDLGRTLILAACVAAAVAGVSAAAGADTAGDKAKRGLAAVTTGFLELPGNMVAETRRNGPVHGMTLGFVKGLGGIVVRELVGVYELVTAPIEAPRGYRPLIEPEYPWDYFDETRAVADDRPPYTVR